MVNGKAGDETVKRDGKLFSSPIPGYAAGALGGAACACGFASLTSGPEAARIAAIPLLFASLVCACAYLVRFRRELMRHGNSSTQYTVKSRQQREITIVSWSVIAACIGLALSILTFCWVFT